ncbi:MAG: hemin uptake protein HemP [Hydrogenovibrio sp.]|uniref:hemin uptake protein HemP n=1 Tax=Hydrogenovibrio TaxID=28884 RepID=UPI0003700A8C|nr:MULTISPECIES: hemin uptake protein HemP [Hydrogenovibrio]MDR9499146.1 hemin uptake protein HemP [Hydrogenovibrio sp.]
MEAYGEGAGRRENESLSDRVDAQAPKQVDSRALLGEADKVIIQHGDQQYLLRRTKENKLILTK